MVLTTFIKYLLHTIDLNSENPWENKAVYMLYTELFTGTVSFIHETVQGQGHYRVKLKSGQDPATRAGWVQKAAFTLAYRGDVSSKTSSGTDPTTL